MAALDLIPNPTMVIAQTGLFLANIAVVKKLIIDPYLKLKDRRFELTTGNKEKAKRILADSEEKSKSIDAQLYNIEQEIKSFRQTRKEEALSNHNKIVQDSKALARQRLEKQREEVSQELKQERNKIPGFVSELSEKVFSAVLK